MYHAAHPKADHLNDDTRPEIERMHLILIADAQRGLTDIAAGRTVEADTALAQLQQQHAGARWPNSRSRT